MDQELLLRLTPPQGKDDACLEWVAQRIETMSLPLTVRQDHATLLIELDLYEIRDQAPVKNDFDILDASLKEIEQDFHDQFVT